MNIQEILKNNYNVSQFIQMIGEEVPFLKLFLTTEQDVIWHSEGNVHTHTDMVLTEIYEIISNQASYLSDDDKFCLIMSALLHDIAKPITTKSVEKNDRICVISPKHEYIGMSYLIHRLQTLKISSDNVLKIIGLVGYHQVPKLLVIRDKNKWEYLNLARKARLNLLYFLEVADIKGRFCEDKADQLEYLELFKMYAIEYGCFDKSNTPFISDNIYVQSKGFQSLLSGSIYMPEEAEAKHFNNKDNHASLVMMVGLSGVGKSLYIQKHYPDHKIVSLDLIREKICKNRQDHSNEGVVLQKAKIDLKTLLNKKEKIVYDATNLRRDFRSKFLDLAENYNALTELVFLSDDINKIYKRDSEREYSVGNKILDYQSKRLEYPEVDESNLYTVKIGDNQCIKNY